MLDINLIRTNPNAVKAGIRAKNADPNLVDQFLKLDTEWRDLSKKRDDFRAKHKSKGGRDTNREALKKEKKEIQELEKKIEEIAIQRTGTLIQMPNLATKETPLGKDESENKEIKTWKDIPQFDYPVKAHYELGESLDLIDTKRAGKVSGTRFGYIKNEAVLLEWALFDFGFKTLIKKGFVPMIPPAMIRKDVMAGLGYHNKGFDESYVLEKDGLCLVGTAEHALVPYFKDETFHESELPKRFVGFSPAFRRESGSSGKDTKGILRVHQFNKLEMVSFVNQEDAEKEHEFLRSIEEELMQALEIPYRVIQSCTGDLGDPAASKFDIEAWFPAEQKYRETHSASNCTDYQARRLNIRVKRTDGKTEFVSILNGTVFSERPILAIMENYQTKDGTIKIPKVLQSYVGVKEIKR